MSIYVTDKELEKLIDKIGYKGCRNCKHQILQIRLCNWGARQRWSGTFYMSEVGDEGGKVMNKEESLSFLQSCIDKVNLATAQDIQFYREMYNKDCAMPMKSSEFEFVFPTDDFDVRKDSGSVILTCRK